MDDPTRALLTDYEIKAAHDGEPYLRSWLLAASRVEQLVRQALEANLEGVPIDRLTQAQKVQAALLVRYCNDVRTAGMLSRFLYPVQVLSLAAGAFESAFWASYIGDDDAKAQEWIDHDDPKRLPESFYEVVRQVVRSITGNDALADQHYRTYRQLCFAKHSNPLFLKGHVFEESEDRVHASPGPNQSLQAVRAVRFGLEQAVRVAELGLHAFFAAFGPQKPELREELGGIQTAFKSLQAEGVNEYGTEDPFPGRW